MEPRVVHVGQLEPEEREGMRVLHRARRRLVRKGQLVSKTEFALRSGTSQSEFRKRVRRGTLFAIKMGRSSYYPAFFLRTDRLGFRLARVAQAMRAMDDAWDKRFELVYEFESLGNRSLLQVMRRAVGFRAAMRYARALAGD